MERVKSVQVLQRFVTGLSKGAFVHLAQGKYFESIGLSKLGAKYIGHHDEEMDWVKKFMNRLLDLGGDLAIEDRTSEELIKDPVAYLSHDLALQNEGLAIILKVMPQLLEDPTTYDIFKAYLADEEQDLYWSEEQLNLINMIGKENWLMSQI